jgi:hypothetical protein
MKKIVLTFVAVFAFALVLAQAAEARSTKVPGGSTIYQAASSTDLSTPLLVVTVRAQGSNRFGHLYWSGATPNVSFDVFRNGQRITRVSGSTTGNNLYTDSVKGLRGTFKYQVCYAGTNICSNSITVVYSSSTETIRYAPECPTTGTAKCIVTLE